MTSFKEKMSNLLRKRTEEKEPEKYYVKGSGWLPVPKDRLNEIPKVIQEHHEWEARRDRLRFGRGI